MNDSNFDYKGSAEVCDAIRATLKGFASIGGINSTDAYNLALMGAEIQRKHNQDLGLKEAASDDVKAALTEALTLLDGAAGALDIGGYGKCANEIRSFLKRAKLLLSSHVTKSADATGVLAEKTCLCGKKFTLDPIAPITCDCGRRWLPLENPPVASVVEHALCETCGADRNTTRCPDCGSFRMPPSASVEHVEQEENKSCKCPIPEGRFAYITTFNCPRCGREWKFSPNSGTWGTLGKPGASHANTVPGQMAWTLTCDTLPSIPKKTSRTFLVTVRSRNGKLYSTTARFAHDYWLEWLDSYEPDEKDVDENGGKAWNGWMEDRLDMGDDEVSRGFDGEVIAWSPMPAPSVPNGTEKQPADQVSQNYCAIHSRYFSGHCTDCASSPSSIVEQEKWERIEKTFALLWDKWLSAGHRGDMNDAMELMARELGKPICPDCKRELVPPGDTCSQCTRPPDMTDSIIHSARMRIPGA